ncbi:hypothetical protein [Prauserella muralis]|uniref:Uncharacterized protein n=1 Tax=Prauserella muralis TaxID=588067 RepID=A0A2V4B0R1_9PSEU|nr:hypothetical protein [Prauserella muralis]PXY27736.1 hypothetical protein BAY60_15230 [Prauserella muralis]TWE22516.1 hypothetical protein FHX69_3758 [Prauserella muralis]
MASGFQVDLAAFSTAKEAVDAAVAHYGALATALEQNIGSLREQEALSGGFGVTGMFQGLLGEFGREWLAQMDQFVAEERAFVEFLKGMSERLQNSHTLYLEAESNHVGLLDEIGRTLDQGGVK